MSFANLIKPPKQLAHRLGWLYSLLFSATLTAALLISYFTAESLMRLQEREDLIEDITDFNTIFDDTGLEGIKSEIWKELLGGEETTAYFIIYDRAGSIVFSSDLDSWTSLPDRAPVLIGISPDEDDWFLEFRTYPGKEYASAIVIGPVGPDYFLEIGESTEEHQEIMDLLLQIYLALFVITIPIVTLGGWIVARRAVRDLANVSDAARRIGNGELDARVAVGPDAVIELSGLASTFNGMAETIEKLLAEMREMTDNVAHDLRSPITRVRAICETVLTSGKDVGDYATAVEDTLIECDRLIALINATLEVSEIETGIRQPPRERLSLSRLVEDACDLYQPLAESHQLTIHCKINNDCVLVGQRYNLQRMFTNILDNAIKYSSPGQSVDVELNKSGNVLLLSVTDKGMGISPVESEKVFNRFYRCASDRGKEGCGLGLSYARAVARNHGGDISISSELNHGSTFTITLPCESRST